MSRLLFAAARGARIQAKTYWQGWSEWETTDDWYGYELDGNHLGIRIHPDDEHLQYGPISTALREGATGVTHIQDTSTYISWVVDGELAALEIDELHRSLFLLILAEALADSGL